MTIFAYIILLLSVISVFLIIHEKKTTPNATWRMVAYSFVILLFFALGCVWYLFNPGFISYRFVLGLSLGVATFSTANCLISVSKGVMPFYHAYFLASASSLVFFALNLIF